MVYIVYGALLFITQSYPDLTVKFLLIYRLRTGSFLSHVCVYKVCHFSVRGIFAQHCTQVDHHPYTYACIITLNFCHHFSLGKNVLRLSISHLEKWWQNARAFVISSNVMLDSLTLVKLININVLLVKHIHIFLVDKYRVQIRHS